MNNNRNMLNGMTTMRQSAPNETLVEVASKYDRCDYQLLFSHLSVSFHHLAQIQFQQVLSFLGTHTSSILNPSMTTTTTTTATTTSSNTQANMISQYEQQSVQKLCYAIVALVVGMFYSLIGYRFLKLSTFLIGFSLGSSIIYLILAEQKQLTLIENLIISLSIGCLFAFVALLVQYIGLFLLGITSSVSIVTCTLIVIDLFHTNNSAWLCILLLFTCATIVASITLKFQKSLTIFNTSAIGAGLLLIALDYFVENNLLIDYIYELYKVNGNSFNIYERQRALLKSSADLVSNEPRSTSTTTAAAIVRSVLTTSKNRAQFNASAKVNATTAPGVDVGATNVGSNSALALFLHLYSSAHARLCWYTWLIFGTYFIMLILSILIQYLVTGKNYDHRDSWQKLIRGSRKKRSANLEKIRLKSHMNESNGHSSTGGAGGSGSHHHQSEHSRDRGRDRDRDRHHHKGHNHHHHHNQHNHHKAHQSSSHPNYSSNDHTSISSSSSDDISISSQNDTLLLVESGRANGACDAACKKPTAAAFHVSSSNEHNNNHHQKRRRKANNEVETTNLEIVSFDVLKSPPRREVKRSKTKQHSSSAGAKTTAAAKIQIQSSSISTTTSTSSASSTCHLIPPKCEPNNNTATTTTSVSVSPKLPEPSAPPMSLASATSTISSSQQQQPPPVPALPPPKLPPLFANGNPATSTTIQQMTSLQNNLAKLKQRNNSTKDRDKDTSDKFRHFYQIRRNNGDVLSQDFLNNFQSKLASSSNLTNSSSGTAAPGGTSSLTSNDPKKKSRSSSSSSKSKS